MNKIEDPFRDKEENTCPACGGTGVQHNTKTGLTVICPVCGGSGIWEKPEPYKMDWEPYPLASPTRQSIE